MALRVEDEAISTSRVTLKRRPCMSTDPLSEARKPRSKAEALGQVFTDPNLADKMVVGLGLKNAATGSRVLDPCVGPSTFLAAIDRVGSSRVVIDALDIDPSMYAIALAASKNIKAKTNIRKVDYLKFSEKNYDFIIMNPPYVRQEWIANKREYQDIISSFIGENIPGTSNLYVYFIIKALSDLRIGGKMACIVYDSWQSTLYGRWLKQQLDNRCVTWRAEPVPACPFEGRLIDATIIYAEKGQPDRSQQAGALVAPHLPGVSSIDTLFHSRRGLRLKQSDFFMTTLDGDHHDAATPFIKKVTKIKGHFVEEDHPEAALLLSNNEGNELTENIISKRLEAALLCPSKNVSILNWYKERPENWNRHKVAPRDPIIFNYYLRHRPRHIINPDMRAYSDNFYGLTPKFKTSSYACLAALNATISVIGILMNARNQGSGLAKLQLFEYRDAQVLDISQWEPSDVNNLAKLGVNLANGNKDSNEIIAEIDSLVSNVCGSDELLPSRLFEIMKNADRKAKTPKAHYL